MLNAFCELSKCMNFDYNRSESICEYFQSHTTRFFVIVFYLATSFGSERGPSSGRYYSPCKMPLISTILYAIEIINMYF
jgi:hypothetical protein